MATTRGLAVVVAVVVDEPLWVPWVARHEGTEGRGKRPTLDSRPSQTQGVPPEIVEADTFAIRKY